MVDPAEGELQQRPQQLSFVDPVLFEYCRRPLKSIGIEVVKLTLADGLMDYVQTFSKKLIQRNLAADSEKSVLNSTGVDSLVNIPSFVLRHFYNEADTFRNVKPWMPSDESVPIEAKWTDR